MPLPGNLFRDRGELRASEPTSENIDITAESHNAFAQSVDAGHRVDPRAQKIFVMCVVLVVLYAVGIIIPKSILNGGYAGSLESVAGGYTLSTFINDLQSNLNSVLLTVMGADTSGLEHGVHKYDITMLRYVIVAVAGMGLAVSGAVYQGAFRNALVSPSTLGVMTGGQFGMLVWVIAVTTMGASAAPMERLDPSKATDFAGYLNSSLGLSLTSFLGCVAVVVLVLATMRLAGVKKSSGIMMIITGQVIGGVFGAVSTAVRYYYTTLDPYGQVADVLQNFAIASFYRDYTVVDVVVLVVPLAVTFAVVMRLRQRMMLLSLDEAEQRAMGVDSRRMQIVVVGLCTLLTAIVISFCGTIGFVGFMVPHLARRLVGPNFKYLLPASLVLGGIFVLGAYTLVDTLLGADYAQLVGMYVSIGGTVVFLVTALRGKGVSYGAFR